MTAPSRKWWVAQVTAYGAFIVALIQNNWQLSSELQVMLVGLVVASVSTYLIPNSPSDPPAGQGVPNA